jgi:GWxTD domain-containing protein
MPSKSNPESHGDAPQAGSRRPAAGDAQHADPRQPAADAAPGPEKVFSVPDYHAPRPRRPDIVSLTALMTARLLRLKPRHGPKVTGGVVRDGLEVPRWAMTLGILLTLLIFLALLALFFVSGEVRAAGLNEINLDKPAKDWYQGPVRYIMTSQEVKAYKALETEVDRQNFIDWFWKRRDFNPTTPENEYRGRFEQRVFDTMRMFGDTVKPGWKTDMGKIYIVVGPPDEINKDTMPKTSRGIITWVYRKPPFPDLPTNTVIAFAKNPDGEFRLSTSPTLDSDVARGLQFSRVKRTADDIILRPGMGDPALLAAGASVNQSEMELRMIATRLQQLPPYEEELFRAFASTREFFQTIPAQSRFDFYRSGDGTTYTTITVAVKSTAVQYKSFGGREVPDVAVFGKLINKNDASDVYALAGDSNFTESLENAAAGPDDVLIYQAIGNFKPGKYQLVLGIEDRVSKKIASLRQEVDVPDLAGAALTLSSITLAGTMEPEEYTPRSAKPYYLGKFRIVPRPESKFRPSDELNVYFQVYNPGLSEASGRPDLDVLYAFRSIAADGTSTDMGAYQIKSSAAQVQGYAVPLAKWPEGHYEIRVSVKDNVSGAATASPAIPFDIRSK